MNTLNRYVEKADFVVIVAPGCLHADRRDPETNLRTKTCYRTYRNRGWCVLEMFASYLSREKAQPALLITSAEGTPEFVSSLEALKLAVGLCDFTCCQRNHKFGNKIVPCDRGITRSILETLIDSKIKHLFESDKDTMHGRLFTCFYSWWTRTLHEGRLSPSKGLKNLKQSIRWNDDEVGHAMFCDSNNISILLYVFVSLIAIMQSMMRTHSLTIVQLRCSCQ